MCTDESVTGAEFYVMELVDGLVLRDEDEVEAAFEEPDRRKLAEALVDTLADLHAVDPDAAGLGELGRRDGYAERQLKRWMRQWEASKTRELDAMDETHRLLSERVPAAALDLARARRLPAGQRDRHAAGRHRGGARLGAVHARRPARRRRAAARLLGGAHRRGRPAHARADARARLPEARRARRALRAALRAATSRSSTSSSRSPTGSWRRSSRACSRATRPASTARPRTSSARSARSSSSSRTRL